MNQLTPEELFNQSKAKALLTFPILEKLGQYLSSNNNLNGKTIAWHCHLTDLTAYAVEVILNSGAKLILSECNPETTSDPAVAFMHSLGASIYLQKNSDINFVASQSFDLISDTGFVFTEAFNKQAHKSIIGACEITSSGITRLRQTKEMPLTVVNINDSNLKSQIENFHGVGDGVVDALHQLTGKMWDGATACVIGYGQVGRGVAWHLRQKGILVSIVESNPLRNLIAHYDGFAIASLDEALSSSKLIVTATGCEFLLTDKHWQHTRDGALLLNVGHLPSEIDRQSLVRLASEHKLVGQHLEEFQIETSAGRKQLYLACAGNPANVVLLSGSIEPTLIHLTTEIMCWDYLVRMHKEGQLLPAGEIAVPLNVEIAVSEFAISALQRTSTAA